MEDSIGFRARPFAFLSLVVLIACGSDGSGTGGQPGRSDGGAGAGGTGPGAGGTAGDAGTSGTGGLGGSSGSAGGVGGVGGVGGAGGSSGAAGDPGSGPTQVRIAATNLSSGNYQSYDPGHGIRILQGLKPDIVLIQELNYGDNTPSDIQSFVDVAFGSGFSYVREGGQIPNGVISRYPILSHGEWGDPEVSNRNFVWARIDLPGSTELWTISVHLLTSKSGDRTKEASALIDHVKAEIPDGDLVVLGGDFNTESRGEGCVATLSARFEMGGPYPADQHGNENTNAFRNNPYDWVVASPALHAMEIPVQVGSQIFAHGLVFDSRVYTPLSDVPPVLQDDSAAPQMQHMAVVREFVLP